MVWTPPVSSAVPRTCICPATCPTFPICRATLCIAASCLCNVRDALLPQPLRCNLWRHQQVFVERPGSDDVIIECARQHKHTLVLFSRGQCRGSGVYPISAVGQFLESAEEDRVVTPTLSRPGLCEGRKAALGAGSTTQGLRNGRAAHQC